MPPKRKKNDCQSLPTDLPENVMNGILMRLPLRDAVRMSILSKKWRYMWCKLPELTLDDDILKTTNNLPSPSIKFASIMYNIFTLHSGPLTKFTLSMTQLRKYPMISSLIYFLSRNGIQHLVLQFSEWNRYKLPSSFFTCSQLRHLTLQNCLLCPPPAFRGFDMLITLELCHVTVSSETLDSLISCSSSLEKLVLKISDTLNHIQIKAPNLRCPDFTGCVKCISLKDVPLLVKLSLICGESFEESEKCDIDTFFQSLPACLDHLCLEYGSLQFLVAELPRKLSTGFNNLKSLYTSLDGLDDLSCALCLIRSSPYLQDIEMEVSFVEFDESDDPVVVSDEVSASFADVTLDHLRTVKIEEITGTKLEMHLIKLLLAKSPILVRMLIEPDEYYVTKEKGAEILSEVTTFPRASGNAELVCEPRRKWR